MMHHYTNFVIVQFVYHSFAFPFMKFIVNISGKARFCKTPGPLAPRNDKQTKCVGSVIEKCISYSNSLRMHRILLN